MSALLFFRATLVIAHTCSNSNSDNSLGRGYQIKSLQKATAEAVDLSFSPAFSRETLFWHYLAFVDTFRKGTPNAVAFKLWVQRHLFFQSSTQCCKAVELHTLPWAMWLNFSALREWEKGKKPTPCKFSINVTEVSITHRAWGLLWAFHIRPVMSRCGCDISTALTQELCPRSLTQYLVLQFSYSFRKR